MKRVLHEYKITGIKTNISYLRHLLDTPDFEQGTYDTKFIETNADFLIKGVSINKEKSENIAYFAAYTHYLKNLHENKPSQPADNRPISRWKEFGMQKEY